jgi:hypothetical protein
MVAGKSEWDNGLLYRRLGRATSSPIRLDYQEHGWYIDDRHDGTQGAIVAFGPLHAGVLLRSSRLQCVSQ